MDKKNIFIILTLVMIVILVLLFIIKKRVNNNLFNQDSIESKKDTYINYNNINSNKCSRIIGSVCSSQSTLKVNKQPFVGINEYSQITYDGPNGSLYGKGIQLWEKTNMQGYLKNYSWDNPNDYQLLRWKADKLGGGPLNKFLPNSKFKAHGNFKVIEAGGKLSHTKDQTGLLAGSFSGNGMNFIGVIC